MDIRLVCVTFLSFDNDLPNMYSMKVSLYLLQQNIVVVFKITKLLLYFLQEFPPEIATLSYLKFANFKNQFLFRGDMQLE